MADSKRHAKTGGRTEECLQANTVDEPSDVSRVSSDVTEPTTLKQVVGSSVDEPSDVSRVSSDVTETTTLKQVVGSSGDALVRHKRGTATEPLSEGQMTHSHANGSQQQPPLQQPIITGCENVQVFFGYPGTQYKQTEQDNVRIEEILEHPTGTQYKQTEQDNVRIEEILEHPTESSNISDGVSDSDDNYYSADETETADERTQHPSSVKTHARHLQRQSRLSIPTRKANSHRKAPPSSHGSVDLTVNPVPHSDIPVCISNHQLSSLPPQHLQNSSSDPAEGSVHQSPDIDIGKSAPLTVPETTSHDNHMTACKVEDTVMPAYRQNTPFPLGSAMNMVLVGKTGNGKSSTANTILSKRVFKATGRDKDRTIRCRKETCVVGGREMHIVDTPGTMDKRRESLEEISNAIYLCPEGFDVILIVMKYGNRMTLEERKAVKHIKKIFGANVLKKYAILVYTGGDMYEHDEDHDENKTFLDFIIEDDDDYLKELFNECENRYILFNNMICKWKEPTYEKATAHQVLILVKEIDKLITKNGGNRYKNYLFQKAKDLKTWVSATDQDEMIKIAKRKKEIETEKKMQETENERKHLESFKFEQIQESEVFKSQMQDLNRQQILLQPSKAGDIISVSKDSWESNLIRETTRVIDLEKQKFEREVDPMCHDGERAWRKPSFQLLRKAVYDVKPPIEGKDTVTSQISVKLEQLEESCRVQVNKNKSLHDSKCNEMCDMMKKRHQNSVKTLVKCETDEQERKWQKSVETYVDKLRHAGREIGPKLIDSAELEYSKFAESYASAQFSWRGDFCKSLEMLKERMKKHIHDMFDNELEKWKDDLKRHRDSWERETLASLEVKCESEKNSMIVSLKEKMVELEGECTSHNTMIIQEHLQKYATVCREEIKTRKISEMRKIVPLDFGAIQRIENLEKVVNEERENWQSNRDKAYEGFVEKYHVYFKPLTFGDYIQETAATERGWKTRDLQCSKYRKMLREEKVKNIMKQRHQEEKSKIKEKKNAFDDCLASMKEKFINNAKQRVVEKLKPGNKQDTILQELNDFEQDWEKIQNSLQTSKEKEWDKQASILDSKEEMQVDTEVSTAGDIFNKEIRAITSNHNRNMENCIADIESKHTKLCVEESRGFNMKTETEVKMTLDSEKKHAFVMFLKEIECFLQEKQNHWDSVVAVEKSKLEHILTEEFSKQIDQGQDDYLQMLPKSEQIIERWTQSVLRKRPCEQDCRSALKTLIKNFDARSQRDLKARLSDLKAAQQQKMQKMSLAMIDKFLLDVKEERQRLETDCEKEITERLNSIMESLSQDFFNKLEKPEESMLLERSKLQEKWILDIKEMRIEAQRTFLDKACLKHFQKTFAETNACFPGCSMVINTSGDAVPIASLSVGDKVLCSTTDGKLKFSEIFRLGHHSWFGVNTYVCIVTSNQRVSASPFHHLHVGTSVKLQHTKTAIDINPGDTLLCYDKDTNTLVPEVVHEVVLTRGDGCFAPYTLAGTILVDGVLASCYVDRVRPPLAHRLLAPARLWYKVTARFHNRTR